MMFGGCGTGGSGGKKTRGLTTWACAGMTPGVGSKTETAMAADPARMRVPAITCCLLMDALLEQVVTGSSAFRARKGLSTTTVARPARGNTDGGFVGGPARCASLGRRSTREWDEPQPLAPSTKSLRGGMHRSPSARVSTRFFQGTTDGLDDLQLATRPTLPPTAAITTLRQRELKRLVASRWTLPALVESRRRFFLRAGMNRPRSYPFWSMMNSQRGRCTRIWHPWPSLSSRPTPCSQCTQMGQVMFACGVVPQSRNSSSWQVRCSLSGLTAFVAVVPPGDIGRE